MLKPAQVDDLLATLDSPVTEFDCGTLCAPGNGGVPVCCHAESIVPVLFKAEFAVLKKRSDLWHKFQPETAQQRELVADSRPQDCLAECKGVEHCERENRSLACRTFPFEPYLDHDGNLLGLVWYYELAHLCPLIGSKHRILPRFIDEAMSMWDKLFEYAPSERAYYVDLSKTVRRSFGQRRKKIPVFTRGGVKRMPTRRA